MKKPGVRPVKQFEFDIKVCYPLVGGELVLRTELDWDRSLKPIEISADGSQFLFRVSSPKAFVYFKPCLDLGSEFVWSLGSNHLATAAGQATSVYPSFFYKGGTISRKPEIYSCQGRDFRVRVYHPPGYHENPFARYPVLYMHDGHNLFFPEEAFAGVTWRVDKTLELLDGMNTVEKVIVVALYPQDRMVDYVQPGYQVYGKFLVESLMPELEQSLNCLKGPENTAVMGSSLGGVVSFYLAWQFPEKFGMAGCFSSTFGYSDDLLDRVVADPKRNVRFYLDSGWPGDNYEVTRNMTAQMLSHGYVWGKDLLSFTYPLAAHSESDWANRFHLPLQYFFSREGRGGQTPV
jgi:predicted alpha/beta superfamily hydrolase